MAGQMLLVGFKGQEPEECGAILGDIQTRHLGGVILFKRDARNAKLPRNIRDAAQVKRLTAALRGASAGHPLFVAVDQEGGKVARFQPGDGFPAYPSAAELGRGTPDATRRTALGMGRMLRELGVNLNFAPVLDVNVYPASPAIGRLGRSFSADPVSYTHLDVYKRQSKKSRLTASCTIQPQVTSSRTVSASAERFSILP